MEYVITCVVLFGIFGLAVVILNSSKDKRFEE